MLLKFYQAAGADRGYDTRTASVILVGLTISLQLLKPSQQEVHLQLNCKQIEPGGGREFRAKGKRGLACRTRSHTLETTRLMGAGRGRDCLHCAGIQ